MYTTSLGILRPRHALIGAVLVAAILTVLIAASGALASNGGVGPGGASSGSGAPSPTADAGGSRNVNPPKYNRLWKRVGPAQRRWARRTGACESGNDPDAIGGGGRYRGAFQFTKGTWKASPRTPGGDPIDYSYRTQAVVAVSLKQRDGARHWPVCG